MSEQYLVCVTSCTTCIRLSTSSRVSQYPDLEAVLVHKLWSRQNNSGSSSLSYVETGDADEKIKIIKDVSNLYEEKLILNENYSFKNNHNSTY